MRSRSVIFIKTKAEMGEHDKKLVELQDFLQRYAIMLTKDSDRAQDLLQETSLRILTNIDKYEDQGRFGSWAKTVMTRVFLNEANKNSKYHNRFVDGYDYTCNESFHPSVADSESIIISKEIYEAIKMLPPRYGQMIVMRIDGYKYEEIAQKMDLSLGCVKSTIFSAKNNLMNIINNR